MEKNLFGVVLSKIKDGMTIVFTKDNIDKDDNFLIFSAYKEIKVWFRRYSSGIVKVFFSCDEPMLLEDCPQSFYKSILKNIEYEIK